MKDILLVGINSQYIHTNLAIRYLKSYVEKYSDKKVDIYESNINNRIDHIITDIYELMPKKIIFSTYIWNKELILLIAKELKKILPDVLIMLGGPEVSYDSENILRQNRFIDAIFIGEGERVLLNYLNNGKIGCKGVAYLEEDRYIYAGDEPVMESLDEIPFPYSQEYLKENIQILYYESSRGCPFNCSYCLSSIDKSVRYRSLELVKKELKIFIDSGIKLVKFVDRTFNLKKERYLEMWNFLLDNYREGIIFHFEINANIFDDETIEFLKKVPKDYFQFEIGVQSINKDTMVSIDRVNDLERLSRNIKSISKNIHLHVDLIAGLPYDSYENFKTSFNYVYDLGAEMIQLGFLKVLSGTKISKELEQYQYKYMDIPPYEVLSNKFISYGDLVKLKNIEKLLDYYYNSEKFRNSVKYIIDNFYDFPFSFFEDIASYYKKRGLLQIGHKIINIFQYILDFYREKGFENENIFIEYLKLDFLLLGKPGSYPEWFISKKDKELHNDVLQGKEFATIREGYKKTEVEFFEYDILNGREGEIILYFDYSKKDVYIEKINR